MIQCRRRLMAKKRFQKKEHLLVAGLTQPEADALIAMDKYRIDDNLWDYPVPGHKITIPLESSNGREQFFLDINRRSRNELKISYQNRARRTEILLRLCSGGSPHRNPDHQEVDSTHLHIYREGYGDKWAVSVPSSTFPTDTSNIGVMFSDFLQLCNIIQPPNIRMAL